MNEQFSRTKLMLGEAGMQKLFRSRVAVFGIGGVGGYVVEALARTGIGFLDIIDNDTVSISNLNRQIYALHSTIGKYKVDVARERILDINPDCTVNVHKTFFLPETASMFCFRDYDYVIDCIDTVTGKIQIAVQSREAGVSVISCMGAGNKMNPTLFEVSDISKTSVCPLARAVRQGLRKHGIYNLKVVYSKEPVMQNKELNDFRVPGSNAFVPSVAGLIIASEVVKDLISY
ncbi:MAG: tRNA threonylcarbamoyladenosine dehydratase [Treponema sp.]|nr:tRNA threonylcarbamoyladenosine dehydratase [Treponema sp.]